jgi:hypothetical protein
LDDLKERRGYSHLKEKALDRTMWRARFGRGFGPVVRQTAEWMNEWVYYITIIRSAWLIYWLFIAYPAAYVLQLGTNEQLWMVR